jgi:hypothetical protein
MQKTRVDVKLLSIEHKFTKNCVRVQIQTGREYHWSNAKEWTKSIKSSSKQHVWNPPAMISLDLSDVGKGDGLKFILQDVAPLMSTMIGEAILTGLDKFNPMEEVHLRVPANQELFFMNIVVMVHGIPKGPTILQTTVIQQDNPNAQFEIQQLQQQVFNLQNEIVLMQQRHQQEVASIHAHYQNQGQQVQTTTQVVYQNQTSPLPQQNPYASSTPVYTQSQQPQYNPQQQMQPQQGQFIQQPQYNSQQMQPQQIQPQQIQPQQMQPQQMQPQQMQPQQMQPQQYQQQPQQGYPQQM